MIIDPRLGSISARDAWQGELFVGQTLALPQPGQAVLGRVGIVLEEIRGSRCRLLNNDSVFTVRYLTLGMFIDNSKERCLFARRWIALCHGRSRDRIYDCQWRFIRAPK